MSKVRDAFSHFARRVASKIGTPIAFMIALLAIIVWAALGPIFGFSDTWQLVINTSTTIVTFLVVFLIQATQNHDAKAIHMKLDELIHGVKHARNELIDAEDFTEDELDRLEHEFSRLRTELAARTRAHKTHSRNEANRLGGAR